MLPLKFVPLGSEEEKPTKDLGQVQVGEEKMKHSICREGEFV